MTTRRLARRLLTFGLCFGVLTLGMARAANAQPISVANTDDSGPGSLRAAIANAMGGEAVDFAGLTGCPCTIALTSGELVVDKNLTIKGPGPTLLTVSGSGVSRVFRIAPDVTAVLEGLQVSGGIGIAEAGSDPSSGGGILNEGTVSLSNVVVSENRALLHPGGGIYSTGDLSISRSAVRNNTAHYGGGIGASGRLTVTESAIAGNSTTSGPGGGIYLDLSGALIVVGSTISNNRAYTFGGGLYGTGTFVNSTISGNQAERGGGVAKGHDEPLALINTTVTGNTATSISPQARSGGGIVLITPSVPVVLTNTIVMGNLPDDVPDLVTSNNSLIGGDAVAVLSPLADNGGPTLTHALLPGSPAIGAGGNAWVPNDALDLDGDGDTAELLPVDQRGAGFARVAGFTVDVGAVEAACAAIIISPATLPNPTVGVAYSQTLTASGGQGLASFSATGLPPDLTLSSDGVFGGTATAAGTFAVTVTAIDVEGCANTHTYTLTIVDESCGIAIGPPTLQAPYLATVYYQRLSMTPSGKYAVNVSAGALPPGVYLFAIGRNWFLGGIPAAPGEYTFTLSATKKHSTCAPTRTYTVIVPPTVLPQLTCVVKTGPKQYTARFGYDNSTGAAAAIVVGTSNYFTPGAQNRGQVTTFQAGRVTDAFSVAFTAKGKSSDLAIWYLRGPDGVRRPVNILAATPRCP